MAKIIDSTNLGYLIGKIKAAFWRKSETSELTIDNSPTSGSNNLVKSGGVYTALSGKQDTLVSGTNIKTVNNESLVGSGNITITGGGSSINSLDDVPDGSTRKLANYVPLSGGTMNENADLEFEDDEDLYSVNISCQNIKLYDYDDVSGVEIDSSAPGMIAMSGALDQSQNYSLYSSGGIVNVVHNGSVQTRYTIALPTMTGTLALTSDIPSAVTESTVSGWGFTKNTGTLTTETDPIFSASAAAGITSSDITNWNGKTSNTGTVTGVKMNGTTNNPTSGVVDLGTVLTSYTETDPTVPSWAKASSKPTYTASEVGALPDTTSIPTESTVSGWGFTKNAAPGTLKTNATTAQTASSGEAMSGTITLHKIAKTGTYSDLIGTPTIPTKVSDLTNDSGFTSNAGTITGITMNGSSKGTSGVVNLGTVLTAHQDISGKANLSGAAFTGTVTGTSSGNTAQFRNVTISSSEPTASQGSNGDIWIVI